MSATPGSSAVLVDPGLPAGLAELLRDTPVALLPMATKPLIQHWVETLAAAGYTDVLILLAHLPERTREFLGDGSRWGLSLRYALHRDGQPVGSLWPQLRDLNVAGLLIADLDALPLPEARDRLKALRQESAGPVALSGADRTLTRLLDDGTGFPEGTAASPCPESVRPVDSYRSVWDLNMALVRAELVDPLPFGFEAEPGVWTASNSRIDATARVVAGSVIGEAAILGRRVRVGPGAVIGARSVIEDSAQVSDSVVFPRSFVGSHLVVSGSLVAGDVLVRVEDGVVLHINDPELIAHGDADFAASTPGQRLAALALLGLLALPMLLVALLGLARGRSLSLREQHWAESGRDLAGNRSLRPLTLRSLDSDHPVWRKLPWLLAAVRGDLALVGTSLRRSAQIDYPDWMSATQSFAPGVITLADASGVDADDTEATVMADVYQMAQNRVGIDWKMIGQWLVRLASSR